ncbi:MAG: serine/threonine-protein phosphatase [Muribaculaceae bacterium]|nr:serine/threonine-protein phosphatase [Muribaculaceae bacterium]
MKELPIWKIAYRAISDVGCIRKNNEDMAYVAGKLIRDGETEGEIDLTEKRPIVAFAVADGMGGYEGGEVASEIACRSFSSFIKKGLPEEDNDAMDAIKQWAVNANNLVLETGKLRPELKEMGTTFTGMIINKESLWIINIGDSRCYRLRNGILKQLSTDHSERERTGNQNVPSNLIYNFLGNYPQDFFSDISIYEPLVGDCYLFCSDGLSDLVNDESIEDYFFEPDKLVEIAKEAGGRDNITLIIIQIDEPLET